MNHTSVKPEINSSGQQYNQPQQYEQLLCQTLTLYYLNIYIH